MALEKILPTMKVKMLDSGAEALINRDEFDAEQHEAIEDVKKKELKQRQQANKQADSIREKRIKSEEREDGTTRTTVSEKRETVTHPEKREVTK